MSVSRRALAYVSRYVSLLLLRLAGTSDGAISRLLTDCAISRISLGHRLRRFFARAADAAKPKHSISGTDSVEHFDKQNYRERSLLRSDELHYYKRYNEPDAACNRSSPCVTRTPCPPKSTCCLHRDVPSSSTVRNDVTPADCECDEAKAYGEWQASCITETAKPHTHLHA